MNIWQNRYKELTQQKGMKVNEPDYNMQHSGFRVLVDSFVFTTVFE